jgi:hypothetical protein
VIQQTSVDAYKTITDSGLLSRKRMEVYEEIYKFQPISINTLIRNLCVTGYNTGSITGRISELQRLGVIAAWGTEIAPTGHEVILWKTTDQLPGKIPKKPTRKQLEGILEKLLIAVANLYNTKDLLFKGDARGPGIELGALALALGAPIEEGLDQPNLEAVDGKP